MKEEGSEKTLSDLWRPEQFKYYVPVSFFFLISSLSAFPVTIFFLKNQHTPCQHAGLWLLNNSNLLTINHTTSNQKRSKT